MRMKRKKREKENHHDIQRCITNIDINIVTSSNDKQVFNCTLKGFQSKSSSSKMQNSNQPHNFARNMNDSRRLPSKQATEQPNETKNEPAKRGDLLD